jgi:RimJ/RimL family protein N-acetyltransferase
MSAEVEIRRELRAGDLGAIVSQHGLLYSREYGLDRSFEAFVAAPISRAGMRGWPAEREAVWIVERDGVFAGSVGLTDEGDGVVMLRWFLLDPGLRGGGLGRRLVGEALEHAERFGFRLLRLETFSELRAAARLYRAYGLEVVSSDTRPRWGRDEITYQRYELALPRSGASHRSVRAFAGSA